MTSQEEWHVPDLSEDDLKFLAELAERQKAAAERQRKRREAWRQSVGAKRGQCITHIDGNPFNNELSNLAVVDRRENYGR